VFSGTSLVSTAEGEIGPASGSSSSSSSYISSLTAEEGVGVVSTEGGKDGVDGLGVDGADDKSLEGIAEGRGRACGTLAFAVFVLTGEPTSFIDLFFLALDETWVAGAATMISSSLAAEARDGACEGVPLEALGWLDGSFSLIDGVDGVLDDCVAEERDSFSLIGAMVLWTCRVEVDGRARTKTRDEHSIKNAIIKKWSIHRLTANSDRLCTLLLQG